MEFMKKIFLVVAILLIVAAPLYFLTASLKAEPVQDYNLVSPTVKIQSYRLSLNGDIYQTNSASATIISSAGLLLTNGHVVLDGQDDPYDVFAICLSFNENEDPVCEYSAFLMAYDKNLDLALLKMAELNNRSLLMPELPYYDYGFAGELKVGQSLDVYGYSDIGGETLTQTKGQVSGFEDKNGVKYIKTDTDISSGNSGGSALDQEGNFVGIPTYVMSSYENLGYILNIAEAKEFIEKNLQAEPQLNEQAYDLLKVKFNLLNDAKDKNYYQHPYYPKFSLTAGEDWEWENLDRTSVTLLSKSNEGDKSINIEVELLPFKVPDAYLDEFARKLNLASDYLTGYQEETVNFAGQEATLVTFNLYNQKFYGYIIPYGYAVVNISYFVELDKQEEDLAKINEVMQSFVFLETQNNQPFVIETLAKSDPAFSISRSGAWYIQRNQQAYLKDLIATYHHPENVIGSIKIYYEEINDDEKELNNAEALDKLLLEYQWMPSFKLVNKDDSVIIDGLAGWSLAYSYESDESQDIRKVSLVYLRNDGYVYKIIYDDSVANYDSYLDDFKSILLSFKNYNQPDELIGQSKYQLGTLDYVFSDILYHRYEQAISNLSDKGVVLGYTDGSFRPEKDIVATEAINYISNSLFESKRTDTIEGGANFLTGMEVKLADALKALAQTYQLNLWSNELGDASDAKIYMDKGYEMGLIPEGIIDPEHALTRGEFTYILFQLLQNFEIF